MKTNASINFDQETLQQAEQVAQSMDRSRSYLINLAVKEWIAQHKDSAGHHLSTRRRRNETYPMKGGA